MGEEFCDVPAPLSIAAQVRGLAFALADAQQLDPESTRLRRAVNRWLDAVDNAEVLAVVAGSVGVSDE